MIDFLGEHEATVDAKGRFLFPSGFKKKLPEGWPGVFVMTRGFDKCLLLYPKDEWDRLDEKLSKLNDFDYKIRLFKRTLYNGVSELEFDSAGRLLIPPNLREDANIQKDIILSGYSGKIEIWDVRTRKEFFDSVTSERFGQMAQELFPDGL
jgi:MraZ protein